MNSMTGSADLVAVDLTDDERDFIVQSLFQWQGPAAGKPFPFQVLGLSSWEQFSKLVVRLERAVASGEALPNLDWARVLFLTEVTFASSLIGSGLDFVFVTAFSDAEAIALLRALQRKIGGYKHAKLLFPDGGRPRTAEEEEELRRFAEKVRREQEGRQYSPSMLTAPTESDRETQLRGLRDDLDAGERSGVSKPFDFDAFVERKRDESRDR
jgi:hypothetical protein